MRVVEQQTVWRSKLMLSMIFGIRVYVAGSGLVVITQEYRLYC